MDIDINDAMGILSSDGLHALAEYSEPAGEMLDMGVSPKMVLKAIATELAIKKLIRTRSKPTKRSIERLADSYFELLYNVYLASD